MYFNRSGFMLPNGMATPPILRGDKEHCRRFPDFGAAPWSASVQVGAAPNDEQNLQPESPGGLDVRTLQFLTMSAS